MLLDSCWKKDELNPSICQIFQVTLREKLTPGKKSRGIDSK